MSVDEARRIELPLKRGRYEQEDVDAYIASLIESFEAVTDERDRLQARVQVLEEELDTLRGLEREVRDTLVAGQRVAKELRDGAEEERQAILATAREEAAALRERTAGEQARLEGEVARLRALEEQVRTGYKQFIVAALELLNESGAAGDRDASRDERPIAEAAADVRA